LYKRNLKVNMKFKFMCLDSRDPVTQYHISLPLGPGSDSDFKIYIIMIMIQVCRKWLIAGSPVKSHQLPSCTWLGPARIR